MQTDPLKIFHILLNFLYMNACSHADLCNLFQAVHDVQKPKRTIVIKWLREKIRYYPRAKNEIKASFQADPRHKRNL